MKFDDNPYCFGVYVLLYISIGSLSYEQKFRFILGHKICLSTS